MTKVIQKPSSSIAEILNGTITAIKSIVPLDHQVMKPENIGSSLNLDFAVLIGVTGDIKAKLIIGGNESVFEAIGESMFGMPLMGEMLTSFKGELGNMIAGNISTIIVNSGINTDITAPTIMEGNTTLKGYKKALKLPFVFEHAGNLDIYLLID